MAKVKKKVTLRREDASGIFVPAGLLIGLGVGMLYGQTAVGALLGLGVGLGLMGVFRLVRK